MREFPGSAEVFHVEHERWRKDHKEPDDHKDAAAWAKYQEDHKRVLKRWIAQYTDAPHTPDTWFYVIYDDDSIAEREGIDALNTYLAGSTEYDQPSAWNYIDAAEFLMNHKWQPERALALLRKAQLLMAKDHEQQLESDNRTEEEVEKTAEYQVFENQHLAGLMLRAAKLAGKADSVETLRASIQGPPPKQKKNESDYWLNRGRLAALEGHQTDALAYYQSALRTRVEPARYRRGKLRDELADEARALWKEAGGTETAWALWSQPPIAKGQELAEGRWEKAKKPLPPFDLSDLSGKTWRLKSLEGKSILINVWATWCGPCQSEQPKLQKLYDQVKDRSDIQILTFNIDEDAGLVAPFLKEKGYTFPVVVAYNYVNSLLDSIGIPQNWIVDPMGVWRWTQLGFDSAETDWSQSMLQRLESVKN
jgi:thiol-disulfide isomerase/thioredoxin